MTVKLIRSTCLVAAVCTFCIGLAAAQYQSGGGQSKTRKTAKRTTVTGCLQQGDEANEYSIATQNGKTYGLRSSRVDLSKHVGHEVSVTGMLRPESAEKGEASETNEANEKKEAGDIQVVRLKMIKDSCQ